MGVLVDVWVAPADRSPADFTGDGGLDLIWQHATTGNLAVWRMNGRTMQSAEPLIPGQITDVNWKVAGTGDFNGDGHPDILWHHQTQGSLAVWLMNGRLQIAAVAVVPDRIADTNWRPVATGDFNGDGKRDIVWRHLTQGHIGVWFMDGVRTLAAVSGTPDRVVDNNWRIVGSGDFNADGRSDLVWRHQGNGQLAIWYMNGASLVSAVSMSPAQVLDTNWEIRAVGDVNRDGRPDLLWQHATSGALSVWFMNGAALVSGQSLVPGTVADLNWKLAGPK
jgi:hypothetical protein